MKAALEHKQNIRHAAVLGHCPTFQNYKVSIAVCLDSLCVCFFIKNRYFWNTAVSRVLLCEHQPEKRHQRNNRGKTMWHQLSLLFQNSLPTGWNSKKPGGPEANRAVQNRSTTHYCYVTAAGQGIQRVERRRGEERRRKKKWGRGGWTSRGEVKWMQSNTEA